MMEILGLVLKTRNTTSKQYIEACAPCHSRRTSLGVEDHRSNDYYNKYRPQLITPDLFIFPMDKYWMKIMFLHLSLKVKCICTMSGVTIVMIHIV